jgi:hypothetical protein
MNTADATGERADAVTVLARVNDTPPRQRESGTLTEVAIPEVAISIETLTWIRTPTSQEPC